MADKKYANEHPKYKKNKKSKSYSEAELLQWDWGTRKRVAEWDKGNIISKMPVKRVKDINLKGKKVDPQKRLKILESKKKGTYSIEV